MLAKNPVIYSDYPDPDVIRVGDTYYLVTTTMHFFPGAQILSSRDMVNWQHVGYVYDRFGETDAQKMLNGAIYGQGMWAPVLRYHKGVFHVVFCCNDTKKCYHYTAADIHGPWKKNYIEGFYHDPSLLFDDDGKVYIVYGNRDIYLTELKSDLSGPLTGGLHRLVLHDECEGLGWEGSHLYKLNGKYYLLNIHWPKGCMRSQGVHVADCLTGEFVGGEVLHADLSGRGCGVAQGGMVDSEEGAWRMLLFQDHGAEGRMPVLVPFAWKNGVPCPEKVPEELEVQEDASVPKLYTSDALKNGFSPLWQWNHEPDEKGIVCTADGLQLTCLGPASHVEQARNTLTQRCFGKACTGDVTVDVSALQEGDYAGICALQGLFGQLCVTVQNGKKYLSLVTREKETDEIFRSPEIPQERQRIPFDGHEITLRLAFDFSDDSVRFFYKKDCEFCQLGSGHRLHYRLDHFTGVRFGLCAFNVNGTGGKAVFRDFVYITE